jgi:hypothetical protein
MHDGNQTGTISMIGREYATRTSLHRQRSMDSVLPAGFREVRSFVLNGGNWRAAVDEDGHYSFAMPL